MSDSFEILYTLWVQVIQYNNQLILQMLHKYIKYYILDFISGFQLK